MLLIAVYETKEKEPKNMISKGFFPGDQLHIEIAMKNSRRPDGSKTDWAYYSFATNQAAAKAFGPVDKPKMMEDFVASALWLKGRPDCTGKIGV